MAKQRRVSVHLLPCLVPGEDLAGSLTVVIDVLRATTTMIYALAAGVRSIRVCGEVAEARTLAEELGRKAVLLAGERGGKPLPGFDLGNSPGEFNARICRDRTLIMTTTNGTRALLHAAGAKRVMIAGFVNFSAVCEQLRLDEGPVHILCAGSEGEVTLEDTLLAGALVEALSDQAVQFNDGARLAWDCFENNGRLLLETLQMSQGGANLRDLGYDEDIRRAAEVDRFTFVPELRPDPWRVELGPVGVHQRHWKVR